MKKTVKFLCLVCLLAFQMAFAQPSANVTVTVQVLPPYSTYLPDYFNNPSRIFFTMLSDQTIEVRLKVSITGDNGISVVSPTTSNVPSIQLLANQMRMFNGTDLKNYLNVNSAIVTGINKSDLYKGTGIPEGTYTVCIQALDFVSGIPVSPEEPIGCSSPFEILQISPPELIAPSCNEVVEAKSVQNIIFSWLPPPNVPVNAQYKLKIVEIIPSTKNPNDAMNSATLPAFFETKTNSLSFFYGPSQPPLKLGNKYAWRVTVNSGGIDGETAPPSNFQNNGNSEVCSFEYKKATEETTSELIPTGIILINPINGEKINNGYGLTFSWKASPKTVKNYRLQFTDRVTQDVKITNWNNLSDDLFSTNGFYAAKDVGSDLKIDLPPSFTTGNGKIAWRIVGLDASDKIIDKSKIETYEITDAPLTDRIKLVTPIQAKQITSGYGLKFQWESSKKKTITGYQVQLTDRYTFDDKITNWVNIDEKLFYKNHPYAAIDTKELFIQTSGQSTSGTGKFAWRVVGLQNNMVVDSSKVETYEIVEDTSEIAFLKGFFINGYYVQITNLFDKNPDKFSGSGTTMLWENGPEVNFNFKDLKVKPFLFVPKLEKYQWAAIEGTIDINTKGMLPNNRIDLATQNDCDGTFQATLNSVKLTAKLEGAMDSGNKVFKITKDLGETNGKVVGKWFTNWFIPINGKQSENLYELESEESDIKMSFANKFDGEITLKSDKIIQTIANGNVSCDFANNFGSQTGSVKLKIKGLEGETSLTGEILVYLANPTDPNSSYQEGLVIPFVSEKNLNFYYTFQKPLIWKLNDDASVKANLTETYVHLSDNGKIESKFESYPNGLNFDKFAVTLQLPQKPGELKQSLVNLNFDRVYNKGNGYSTPGKSEDDSISVVNVAGFKTKIEKSNFMLVNNKLVYMYVKGQLYVPFINDWSAIFIEIDSKKIQSFNLGFDFNKKYYLSQSKGETYIKLYAGRLDNTSIVVAPAIYMTSNDNKGVETQGMSMCELFIENTGAVSFDTNFSANSESVCEGNKKWATYYKFDYAIDKMKIKQKAIKTDTEFVFSGDVIMAPNIVTKSKKITGFIYHGKAPNRVAFNESNLKNYQDVASTNEVVSVEINSESEINKVENTIEYTDDNKAIAAGYEDGAQKFGGGFFLKQNDPVWGDCFELGGSYQTKEPECAGLKVKLIVGKKNNNGSKFSYWFSEFSQKNIVVVPIIPAILEANGFGGKAYYHMQVDYTNIGTISTMSPNNAFSLGLVAEADVRTTDKGILLHGHATIVTQFKGWSIDGIKYYIKGDAISQNDSSPGLLQARMNGQLNWVDKYIDGKGQIWGGVKDIVCINEGEANEDSVFFHFGADDFYIKVGTKENPITAEVLCGNGWATGVWLNFDKNNLALGFENNYNSGWKELNLGVASAAAALVASLKANINVKYSPFQATGTAEFHGAAYGRGCVDFWVFSGCIGGKCTADAALTVSMPNPVSISGSIVCDVHKYIPNFTLNASWSSNGGFKISL